jgi:hypothetical protein
MGLEELVDPNFLFMLFCNVLSFTWGALMPETAYKSVLNVGDGDRGYGFGVPAAIAGVLLPAALTWKNTSYLVGYLLPALLGTIVSSGNVIRRESKLIRELAYPT